jgi:hypothetical protein
MLLLVLMLLPALVLARVVKLRKAAGWSRLKGPLLQVQGPGLD